MKIITWNVNGIRAIERKGELQNLIKSARPDILLLQEIKGNAEQFSDYLNDNDDYEVFYHSAVKKGYAGTGVWVAKSFMKKIADIKFITEIPNAPNGDEGRLAQISFEVGGQRWEVLSIYFPNGGKSEQAWEEKLVFYKRTLEYMNCLREAGAVVVVGGDMNVAHREIDLARPKDNDGKIGFHPKERAWMDKVVAAGWADVWRSRNPDTRDVYSWWHMISKARERNIGWRIDYFLIGEKDLSRVSCCEYLMKQMGSDHCPLTMEIG